MTTDEELEQIRQQRAALDKREAELRARVPSVLWVRVDPDDQSSHREKTHATKAALHYGGRVVPYVAAENARWGILYGCIASEGPNEEVARRLVAQSPATRTLVRIIVVPAEELE